MAKDSEERSLTGGMSPKKLTLAQRRENKRIVADEFRKMRFPTLVSNALLARIEAESHFDPRAVNLDDPNGGSAGLFMWNDARLRGVAEYAKKEGVDPDDIRMQARFLGGEVMGQFGTEGNYGKKLLDAANPKDAAKAVMGLARPQGWTQKNPEKGLGYEFTLKRIEDYVDASTRVKKEQEAGLQDSDPGQLNAILTGLGNNSTIPIPSKNPENPVNLLEKEKTKPDPDLLALFVGGASMVGKGLKGGIATSGATASQMVSNNLSGTHKSITGFLQSLPNVGGVGPTAIRR